MRIVSLQLHGKLVQDGLQKNDGPQNKAGSFSVSSPERQLNVAGVIFSVRATHTCSFKVKLTASKHSPFFAMFFL